MTDVTCQYLQKVKSMNSLIFNEVKRIIQKYKDIIPYAIFGILTTIVNIFSYWCCAHVFGVPVICSTIIGGCGRFSGLSNVS